MDIVIKKADLKKSEEMFKKQAEYEAYGHAYEKEQRAFIHSMIKKYNVKTLDDFKKLRELFPESVSLVFAFKRFLDVEKKEGGVNDDCSQGSESLS